MSLLQIVEPGKSSFEESNDLRSEQAKPIAVGIDFGTTNTLAAITWSRDDNGGESEYNTELVPLGNGAIASGNDDKYLLPSVIGYDFANEEFVVGEKAKSCVSHIYSIKRLFSQDMDQIKTYPKGRNYRIEKTDNSLDIVFYDLGDGLDHNNSSDANVNNNCKSEKRLNIIKAASMILDHVRQKLESFLQAKGHPVAKVEKVVITVPAYFDDAARALVKQAGSLAGLDVMRVINEPTAAALAYGVNSNNVGNYVIYDFGGGTFDVSILTLEKGLFKVIASAGDTQLGGDDIDEAIAGRIYVDKLAAKKIKHDPDLLKKNPELRSILKPIIEKTINITNMAINDAGIDLCDIKDIILVGGSTRLSIVAYMIEEAFGINPKHYLNPDQTVVIGASIQAYSLINGASTLLLDVTPLSLGIETYGGIVEKIIPRNSPIPVAKAQEFTTFKDHQTSMLIHVLQGERELVKDCKSLAKFELSRIPPKVAGSAIIVVTFKVDADGLLTVSAYEKESGKEQHIEVIPSYGMSVEDIKNMVFDSIENGEEDMKMRLLQESKVRAQRLLIAIEKALLDDVDLLSAPEKEKIDKAIQNLIKSLDENDKDIIDKACDEFEESTKFFAQLRMDRYIKNALEGKSTEEVAKKLSSS